MMTEEEISQAYKDVIDVSNATKYPNATYYGTATIADRNGASESLHGKKGRAWRDARWIQQEGISEGEDERGSRERWLFLPEQQGRKDKNIFIVYIGNLQFL